MVCGTGQGLVHAVVDDLPEAVHQATGVGGSDVHPGPLADRLEALQDQEVCGVVGGVDRVLPGWVGAEIRQTGQVRIYSRHADAGWSHAWHPRV